MTERERFEKWAKTRPRLSNNLDRTEDDKEYRWFLAHDAFEAWQASAREQMLEAANLIERLIDQTYADAEGAAAKNAFMYAATYLRKHAVESFEREANERRKS